MRIGINRRLRQKSQENKERRKSVGLRGIPGSSDPALLLKAGRVLSPSIPTGRLVQSQIAL